MLAYNKQDLNNFFIREQVKKAASRESITTDEKTNILNAYPVSFYTPNFFIRIGLGIVTLTAYWALSGFIDSFIKSKDVMSYVLMAVFILLLCTLEFFIKRYHHFRSGIDDILLYAALITFYSALGISQLNKWKHFDLLMPLVMTITGILATLRYSDRLVTISGFLPGLFFTGLLFYKTGILTKHALPFLIILLSLTVYLLARQYRKRPALRHYFNCLWILEISALCTLYIAGNYFAASMWWEKQLSSELSNDPWKYFFIASTALIPFWCLYTGLRKQEIIQSRLSVLMIAASICTFHYYVEVISREAEMIFYGTLLIMIAYFLIRQLKKGIPGFTYNSMEDSAGMIEMEELFIGGTFSAKGKS